MFQTPDCNAVNLVEVIAANLPGTLAALGGLIIVWRGRDKLEYVRHRADQLYNGEFARGVAQGHREERREEREFTQS